MKKHRLIVNLTEQDDGKLSCEAVVPEATLTTPRVVQSYLMAAFTIAVMNGMTREQVVSMAITLSRDPGTLPAKGIVN